MTILEAFNHYISDYILFKNLSKNTEEAYLCTAKLLFTYFGESQIEELTLQSIRRWKQWLDKGRCQSTVRGYVICLRVVLKYHRQIGLNVIDPETIPVPKRLYKVPQFISADEVKTFIQEAGKPIRGYSKLNRIRNQAIISLIYSSGVRVSECCRLNIGDMRNRTFTVVGKGGKPRLCFIDERTERLIGLYITMRKDNSPALFVSKTGQRIRPNNVQRFFQLISSRCDMQIHPHTLRHSFATNLLNNNCNMRYVQVLLGHSSLATTQMYTHVVDRDLQDIYAQYHTV
jgi:site-specific recombinase XerD